jgi:hypothetical protein
MLQKSNQSEKLQVLKLCIVQHTQSLSILLIPKYNEFRFDFFCTVVYLIAIYVPLDFFV